MLNSATGTTISAPDLYALLKLRVDVFVVEQQAAYPELDGQDLLPTTTHLWWSTGDAPQATLRLLAHAPELRIGRVCTAADARGRGLSAALMSEAVRLVGDRPSILDAQTAVMGFYARFGYAPVGEEFVEDGIPHRTMRRVP